MMRSTSCLLFVAIGACSHGGGTPVDPPEPLEPLASTGQLLIDMNGTWEITEVVVETESPAHQQLEVPGGLMPPVVGGLVRIEGNRLVSADDRDLARDASGFPEVVGYQNRVDGRTVRYSRRGVAQSRPGVADSGGSQTLQMALGSVDADTMAGLVQHNFAQAFPPRDRPSFGRYVIALERVAPKDGQPVEGR